MISYPRAAMRFPHRFTHKLQNCTGIHLHGIAFACVAKSPGTRGRKACSLRMRSLDERLCHSITVR